MEPDINISVEESTIKSNLVHSVVTESNILPHKLEISQGTIDPTFHNTFVEDTNCTENRNLVSSTDTSIPIEEPMEQCNSLNVSSISEPSDETLCAINNTECVQQCESGVETTVDATEVYDSTLRLEPSGSEDCVPPQSSVQEQSEMSIEEHEIVESNSEVVTTEIKQDVYPPYEFEGEIQLITGVWTEFKTSATSKECFTKGCKWAPDGTCILTSSEDCVLRIFDLPRDLHCQKSWLLGRTLPEMSPALRVSEGALIYDYGWYPLMSSMDPLSCCFVSTSQYNPIHLWDAYTGELRCTYRPYNCMDEVVHAFSVVFSYTGEKLYCGFKDSVRVFDTNTPGRDCELRSLKGCGKNVGIVSSISLNPAMPKLYAAGGYLGTLALCSEPEGQVYCLLCGQQGGITHTMFSPDGTKLYAGSRRNSEIFCWDMRNLGTVLCTLQREVTTNQRIYFDITPNGQYIMSGSTNGKVNVWNTLVPPEENSSSAILPVFNSFQANNDCVNGMSLHQQYPILATSSGQRHYTEIDSEDEEGNDAALPPMKQRKVEQDNSLKLWWLGPSSEHEPEPEREEKRYTIEIKV